MRIQIDDLSDSRVLELLREHVNSMGSLSQAEHVHALDVSGLRAPEITVWTVWDEDVLLGCGALKQLTPTHGEVKSMRTPLANRRRGAGRAVLTHIVEEARRRGYRRLSLETGTHPAFVPAQTLYQSFGFVRCAAFGDYSESPDNRFMTLELAKSTKHLQP